MKVSIGKLSTHYSDKHGIKPGSKPSSGDIHEVSATKCFDEPTIL